MKNTKVKKLEMLIVLIIFLDWMELIHCLHQSDVKIQLVRNTNSSRKDNIMTVVELSSHLNCIVHIS